MSIAHYFTLLRIVIAPLFPLFYLEYEWLGIPFDLMPYILIFLLIVCESSDLIDGIVARRCNQVTDLGKILDPMADSIMRISLFLTLTQGPVSLPLMLVLVFFYREFFITTLRTVCALRGVALAARTSGKTKAFLQACALFLILLLLVPYTMGFLSIETLRQVSLIATSIAATYAVISAFDYLYSNREYLKKALDFI